MEAEPVEQVVEELEAEDIDEPPAEITLAPVTSKVAKKAILVEYQQLEVKYETSQEAVVLPETRQEEETGEPSPQVQREKTSLVQSIVAEEAGHGKNVVVPSPDILEKNALSLDGKPNIQKESANAAHEVILLEGGIPPQDITSLFPLSGKITLGEVNTEGTLATEKGGEIQGQGLEGGTRRKISAVDEIAQLLQESTGQELIASFVGSFAYVDSEDAFPTVSSSESIDIFRAVGAQETTRIAEPRIQVMQEGGKIVIGAQKIQESNASQTEAHDEMHPLLEAMVALRTVEELAKALDVLEILTLDISKEAKTQAVVEEKEVARDTVVLKEAEHAKNNETSSVQENKTTEITILVSDNLMTFIDTGKKVLDTLEKRKARLSCGSTLEQDGVQKQLVRITSGQKEIIIELEMLKKLLELDKMKGQIVSRVLLQKNETALEELGLHTMTPNLDTMVAFWFVYQLVVFSFASIEETQLLSYDRIVPQQFSSRVLHA